MNFRSVSRVLAALMLALGFSACLPALVALVAGERVQAFAFFATFLVVATVSGSVLVLVRNPPRTSRPQDGLGVMLLWWCLSPLAAALPFIIGVDNTSVLTGVHEAISCLTATGHSVIAVENDIWPRSLIAWRGVLHVWGVIAVLVGAVCVLAGLNAGGPGVHRTPLFSASRESFFDGVPKVLQHIIVIVVVSIGIGTFILTLTGLAPARALGEAISVLTTGQVFPASVPRGATSLMTSIALGFGLMMGALFFAIALPLRARNLRAAVLDPETVLFLVLWILFALLVLPAGLAPGEALAWSVQALSTSGIEITDAPLATEAPLAVAILPALIGGSALSAAGGVKLARFIVLSRRAGLEFRQLGFRRSVLRFDFRGRDFDERSVFGVWIYLLAYVLAVFVVLLGLTFAGEGLVEAIRLATGALSNSAFLTGTHVANLSPAGEAIMIFALILGRLEVLAFLPALSPQFWRG